MTPLDLSELAAIPRDDEGPVFRAPWEAQAFAMAVLLHERGHFTWKEWSARLAAEIAGAKARGETDDGSHYYQYWLAALERLVAEKGLVLAEGDGSGFYRFVPSTPPAGPGDLAANGGVLEMMKIDLASGYETAINQQVGVPLPVSWVPIVDPDPVPPTAVVGGITVSAVFKQGLDAGGARFRRLEGCWFDGGKVYFDSTNGGDKGLGQVWVYDPSVETLTMIFESPGVDVLDAPDNMCVSPRGGIVACEDNGGVQFLRGISQSGESFEFARNIYNAIEFAGACFSPDGMTLFVNIYGRSTVRTTLPYKSPMQIILGPERHELATTLAIWGPWQSGLL